MRCKSIDQLVSDSENAEVKLKKSLGWVSLTSLGIGAVIGSGIFTVIGTAIAGQKMQVSSVLNAPLLQYLIYHSISFRRHGGRIDRCDQRVGLDSRVCRLQHGRECRFLGPHGRSARLVRMAS